MPIRAVSGKVTFMDQKRTLVIRPGQKFRHKRKKTIYIVKSIKDREDAVLLVSENGEASMLIQMDELMSDGFEPVYD